MSYPRNLSSFAALLALSLSSPPASGADLYDQATLLDAISKATAKPDVVTCDPYIDVGCTLPRPQTPFGCSDCNPGDFSQAFVKEKKFALPEVIDLGGRKIELLGDPIKQDYSIFSMPAETGF